MWSRLGWPALVVLAWALLLASSTTSSAALEQGALILVTAMAAGACWTRAVRGPAQERTIWLLFGAGLTGYSAGYVMLFGVSSGEGGGPWGLNYSDCLSLAFFPLCLAALLVLTRRRVQAIDPRALLDGLVVALATSSVAIAIAGAHAPQLFEGGVLAALYRTAYPVGTLVLFVMTVCGAVAARRLDRVWVLLLVGFGVMTSAEVVYGLQSAAGTFRFGTPLDAAFVTGPCLVALAAWSSSWTVPRTGGPISGSSNTVMVMTAIATLSTLTVLVDRDPQIPSVAIVLGAVGVVAAVLRTVLFVRQDHLLEVRTRQAMTDPLTDLPNRRLLISTVGTRLAAGQEPVLLMFDLDRFKSLNDGLGHAAGDALLQEVARRLCDQAPEASLIARLGGDEFAILLPAGRVDPVEVAERLRAAVEQPVSLAGKLVVVAGSVGIGPGAGLAGAPGPAGPSGVTGEAPAGISELLRRADVALRRAKTTASGIELWSPAFDDGARDRLRLLAELRTGLREGDQLVVHLQPKCDTRTRAVRAYEALVRWQHPTRGLVPPVEFIDLAEEGGLLSEITAAVLDASLRAVCELQAAGHRLPVAVNVGAPDLLDPRFASRIAQALDRHGVPASLLRLEVTETVVMSDPARVVRTLRLLRGIGVGISLDDYGTGLSSLAYLRELPIDELKIDRTFIAHLRDEQTSRLIVTSTIELAHAMGLVVVAEGIEDDATLSMLASTGCDLVQGYLLGRPAPLAQQLQQLDQAAGVAPVPEQLDGADGAALLGVGRP